MESTSKINRHKAGNHMVVGRGKSIIFSVSKPNTDINRIVSFPPVFSEESPFESGIKRDRVSKPGLKIYRLSHAKITVLVPMKVHMVIDIIIDTSIESGEAIVLCIRILILRQRHMPELCGEGKRPVFGDQILDL